MKSGPNGDRQVRIGWDVYVKMGVLLFASGAAWGLQLEETTKAASISTSIYCRAGSHPAKKRHRIYGKSHQVMTLQP